MLLDTVVSHAVPVLEDFRSKGVHLIFLTGRNAQYRLATEEWLKTHVGWRGGIREPLVMRPLNGANIAASIMKEKLFVEDVASKYNGVTFLFFEDDPHVMPIWSKYGLVFKCPDAWELMVVKPKSEEEPVWNR
jgi:hypothetical protein